MSKKVWLDGNLVPAEHATVSVFDHGVLYGDGVFEGIRIYNNRILKCATHVARLFESAHSIRLTIPYTAKEITDALYETCKANDITNGYIRLVVTRGAGTLGLNPFTCKRASVYAIADSITLYPKEMYDNGMAIITSSVTRTHPAALSPRIKSLNYLNNILAKIEAIDNGVMEAVMLNSQGFVAECTGDNIFIIRDWEGVKTLIPPPLHAGTLEGVTMNLVIELAKKAGIPVLRTDLTKHDLYIAEEMFLTGTAAEVIAVTKVDNRVIGDGKPGPVTNQLLAAFRELVANAPED